LALWEKEEEVESRRKYLVYALTLIFSLTGLGLILMSFVDLELTMRLFREDGVIEYLQTFMFAIAGALWLYAVLKVRRVGEDTRREQRLYFALGMVMIFFVMEEISWGQRIFDYSTPDRLAAVNLQGEFNLHNLKWSAGDGPPPYNLVAAVILIVAICIIVVSKFYPSTKKHLEGILIPLHQYDLVMFLMLVTAFANYSDPPMLYWLIAVPFLLPILALLSGKFKDFFDNFTAPGLQFSMLAIIAVFVLALNFNPATEPYLSHNIAFEIREVILAMALVCYPLFEMNDISKKTEEL